MEVFAIALSIPAALAASFVYSSWLRAAATRWPWLRLPFQIGSVIVFAMLGCELFLLVSLGAVESRRLLGPGFFAAHLICFILGTPALANTLMLQRRFPRLARPSMVCVPCAALAFFLTLLQYAVSEELYGIDGTNGPFSSGSGIRESPRAITNPNGVATQSLGLRSYSRSCSDWDSPLRRRRCVVHAEIMRRNAFGVRTSSGTGAKQSLLTLRLPLLHFVG